MKRLFYSYICYCFLFVAITVQNISAQQINVDTLKQVVVEGKSFYIYPIAKGEGLFTVGKKFGLSTQDIIQYNPEASNGLKMGQTLKIPIIEGRNKKSDISTSSSFIFHKVEAGQNLFFISRKYGVSIDDIEKHNPGVKQKLNTGTDLKIPSVQQKPAETKKTATEYISYTVKIDDTLYKLSKLYNVSIEDILAANTIAASRLMNIGNVIRIPKKGSSESSTDQTAFDASTAAAKPTVTKPITNAASSEKHNRYTVQPGETLFGISKKFGITSEELITINNITNASDIKAGNDIYIPKTAVSKTVESTNKETDQTKMIANKPEPTFVFLTIDSKTETLDAVAARYKTTNAELIKLNPGLVLGKKNQIAKGVEIKIPLPKIPETAQNTVKTETKPVTQTIPEKEEPKTVTPAQPQSIKAGCAKLTTPAVVNVAFMGPLYTEMLVTDNSVSEDDESAQSFNVFKEFYFGALLAIDSLKRMGFSVNVYTYDLMKYPGDVASLKNVLAKPELKTMDLIIGPASSLQIPTVAAYCAEHKIPMIVPIGSYISSIQNNPYVYQLNANESDLWGKATNFIARKYGKANIIVIHSSNPDSRETNFVQSLKRELYANNATPGSMPSFKEYSLATHGISGLRNILSTDKENIIIIPNRNQETFNKAIPSLENLQQKNEYNITLFGFPEYVSANSKDIKSMYTIGTLLFNQYYANYERNDVKKILEKYKNWYGGEPTVFNSKYGIISPNFGLLGYDVAFYFIAAAGSYGNAFANCLQNIDVDLMQSNFKFESIQGASKVNRQLFFIRYGDDFTTTIER